MTVKQPAAFVRAQERRQAKTVDDRSITLIRSLIAACREVQSTMSGKRQKGKDDWRVIRTEVWAKVEMALRHLEGK
jgi:hypothetical protein